jgi:D-alanyl-D-alanine carboxypeptidase
LATPDDEFAIASITKTFTAALIMRLAEQGRIDLDALLASYLGDLEVDANGATVRQALEMRAGLADNGPEVADQIVADPARVWTWDEIAARYKPPVAPPGDYQDSSPGYELLAYAAERVTGMSYGSALRAEVLDPVQADRILDQAVGVVTPQPWALPIGEHLGRFTPEDMGAGGALSCMSSATRGTGAGSVASDAPSLAAWIWHLFAGDIVSPASLDTMLGGVDRRFAFGLEPAPYSEPGSVAASGNKTGYGSQFVYFPASRAVIVIFVNDPDFVVEPTVNLLLSTAVST